MQVILFSDIFGSTPALAKLATHLACETTPLIVDPYGGHFLEFTLEDDAYAYFTKHVGIERYTQIIEKKLKTITGELFLIGFSMGASALWCVLSKRVVNGRAVCYYGSQIRDHTHLTPLIPTTLIFPFQEPHFDVGRLTRQMGRKDLVSCRTVPYLHGFMNSMSFNYNEDACYQELERLNQSIGK